MPRDTSAPESPSPFRAPIPGIAVPPTPWLPPDQESPEDHPLGSDPYDERPSTTASTDRLPGGDPEKVAKVLGGLLVLALGTLSLLARRRDRQLRMPTPRERDDIAEPLARIAVRHLPMDALGPDLVDGTEALVAMHGYVFAGPLLEPATGPDVEIEIPEFTDDNYDDAYRSN